MTVSGGAPTKEPTDARAWWWLSTPLMTVAVATDEALIVREAPPIVRMFIGQPSRNLGSWMRKQGGFRASPLRGVSP